MKKVKVIVLRTAGTNNDIETALAYKLSGADVDVIHINKLLKKEVKLSPYQIMAIPGGFSYGDDISAGKIFANKLKYKLRNEIQEFSKSGKLIIGICNGFQILVKTGLLPFKDDKQSVTLTFNDSGKFECRWTYLKKVYRENDSKRTIGSFWVKNLPDVIELPVAHGEGKFYTSKDILAKLNEDNLIIFKYCTQVGEDGDYPDNPNGSLENIAAITNTEGNILGMMPHPERFVLNYQHYSWTRNTSRVPFGFIIINNSVNYAKRNL